MIGKILFPVDFSLSCESMAAYVKRAAEMFGAHVTLVHVCDLYSNNGFELVVRNLREVGEDHLCIAQERLDSFLPSEFPPADCARILRTGEAAAQIAETARTGGFDLIIMPTHAGRFRRMLLGSTTAKVLNDADCPVMTTQHAETIAPRPLDDRTWVCAIGLSQDLERVLRIASREAAAEGAKLFVIHAAPDDDEANARQRLDALLRATADALIIGRRPRSGTLGRLRDLTYSLVRDSPFPVLSV